MLKHGSPVVFPTVMEDVFQFLNRYQWYFDVSFFHIIINNFWLMNFRCSLTKQKNIGLLSYFEQLLIQDAQNK